MHIMALKRCVSATARVSQLSFKKLRVRAFRLAAQHLDKPVIGINDHMIAGADYA